MNVKKLSAQQVLGAAAALMMSTAVQAQPGGSPPAPVLQPGQPTQVNAVGTVQNVSVAEQLRDVMGEEVRDTVKLYLAGKIAQWYIRRDTNGVVFILNATSAEEAAAMLAPLPLVKQQLMRFEYIPVGPLSPLALLIQPGKTQTLPE
jgi:hypothetical protein